jgi:hypothetical protein
MASNNGPAPASNSPPASNPQQPSVIQDQPLVYCEQYGYEAALIPPVEVDQGQKKAKRPRLDSVGHSNTSSPDSFWSNSSDPYVSPEDFELIIGPAPVANSHPDYQRSWNQDHQDGFQGPSKKRNHYASWFTPPVQGDIEHKDTETPKLDSGGHSSSIGTTSLESSMSKKPETNVVHLGKEDFNALEDCFPDPGGDYMDKWLDSVIGKSEIDSVIGQSEIDSVIDKSEIKNFERKDESNNSESTKIPITKEDVETFEKGQNMVDDRIIDLYLKIVASRRQEHNLAIWAMNTRFLPMLLTSGYDSVSEFTKTVDLFSYDLILVPIKLTNHWFSAVIHLKKKMVFCHDPFGKRYCQTIFKILLRYLVAESLNRKKMPLDLSRFRFRGVQNLPIQEKSNDSGVFMLKYADGLSTKVSRKIWPKDIPFYRQDLARIMKSHIEEHKQLTSKK